MVVKTTKINASDDELKRAGERFEKASLMETKAIDGHNNEDEKVKIPKQKVSKKKDDDSEKTKKVKIIYTATKLPSDTKTTTYRYASMSEAVEAGKVMYWGVKKADSKILNL